MIREFVQMNSDIFSYANKRLVDYFNFVGYEAKDELVKIKNEVSAKKLFYGYLTDLQSALNRQLISSAEIDSVSQLFKEEYINFLSENQRVQRSFALSFNDVLPLFARRNFSPSLRDMKLNQYFNSLYIDLTDYRIVYGNSAVVTEPVVINPNEPIAGANTYKTVRTGLVDTSTIGMRIDSFIGAVKELYGIR
ncbi:MAG: hypothetical protein INR73_17595 [Williamsia sp.]|nr:hypothetical protein [Williamsia sp.]